MISLYNLFEHKTKNYLIKKLNNEESEKFISNFKNTSSKYLKQHQIYCVFDKEEQIGGLVINLKPTQIKDGPIGQVAITFLYVKPKYRKKNIANNLIKLMFTKYKSIILTTNHHSSKESIHLYKKFGFKIINNKGTTKYWYWRMNQND